MGAAVSGRSAMDGEVSEPLCSTSGSLCTVYKTALCPGSGP